MQFCIKGHSQLAVACDTWLNTSALDQKVTVGDLDVVGDKITVEAIFNLSGPDNLGVPHGGKLVSKHTHDYNLNYSLIPHGCEITTNQSGYKVLLVCPALRNKTYHAAMVYDGKSLKFYRNGILMAETPCTGNLINNDLPTTIAQLSGTAIIEGNQFSGVVNEVRIWNVARTQEHIRAFMNRSLPTTNEPGLLGYYIFNDLKNKTGNSAYDGVLHNGAFINAVNPNCSFEPSSCDQVAEVIAGFTAPDTVCVNTPVDIANISLNASTYSWNFCMADVSKSVPVASGLGNPGSMLNQPGYSEIVEAGGNYYQFILNQNPGSLIRLDYGNSLLNTPTAVNLGNFGGLLTNTNAAVQIVKVNNDWFGIITGGDGSAGSPARLIRLAFGTDITNNSPTATDWGNPGNNLHSPASLKIANEGSNWYGFITNSNNNSLARVTFPSNFAGTPTVVSLNIPGLNIPRGIELIRNDGEWHLFVTNLSTSTIIRLDFGASLANNNPAITSLGSLNLTLNNPRDIRIMQYCGHAVGYVVNGTDIVRLNFEHGLYSLPSAESLGDFGLLNAPASITSLFTFNSNLYGFVLNAGDNSVTRLTFSGCSNSSNPGSSDPSPPIIMYNQPGTYYISLTVNQGTSTQTSYCKPIVVLDALVKNPVLQLNICPGQTVRLERNYPLGASYLWKDGTTDNFIDVTSTGTYWVEVERFGCTTRDSFLLAPEVGDFRLIRDICNPWMVTYVNETPETVSIVWDLGNGVNSTDNITAVDYGTDGTYTVTMQATTQNGCQIVVTKEHIITVGSSDLILTPDTLVCFGTTKLLRAQASSRFCWQPDLTLTNSHLLTPDATPEENHTYYFTAEMSGANLLANGDFSLGNTGFNSAYPLTLQNTTGGQYYVGPDPQLWNPALSACSGRSGTGDNMMYVNGNGTDALIWSSSLTINPNTIYTFSVWVQNLIANRPVQLQLMINGVNMGEVFQTGGATCLWQQFSTSWNSGSQTEVTIAIVYKNAGGNPTYFALDDISFHSIDIHREAVTLTVDKPEIKTIEDISICHDGEVELTTTGGVSYSWTPAATLSDAASGNPIAKPTTVTEYIVTGTNANGCSAKDTVLVSLFDRPVISKSADTTICPNTTIQLNASGGVAYKWQPDASLNDPEIPDPIAAPDAPTTYYVTVTDANSCTNTASININIHQLPEFKINTAISACDKSEVQLQAEGGNIYSWTPVTGLSNPNIANPKVVVDGSRDYAVHITETLCNTSTTLYTRVNALLLPNVKATSSNDLDCTNNQAQLNATGALSYVWTPESSLSDPAVANPIATPRETTSYIVRGTDAAGCINYDTLTVKVDNTNRTGYPMANAFSPNNDGMNDCFGIKNWGYIEKVEFSIYNRWGQRIFFTTNSNDCWDGTYKGVKQPVGTYVFMIKAKTNCEEAVFRKGTVVLMR